MFGLNLRLKMLKVYGALKEFGAPLKDVKIEDFTRPDLIYQVGVPPVRVDIIMSVMGMGFEAAWKTRTRTKIDEVETNIIGMRDLVKSKERVSRPADLIDIANLKLGLKLKRRS